MHIFLYSPELLTFFRNSRWRPPPSWIFRLCEFGHSGVLIVWYLCCVPNLVQISVVVTEIDALMLQAPLYPHRTLWRYTNAVLLLLLLLEVHLMTSRELTSGFDFWSRGHLRMAVMHLSIKFGADIFIQAGVIDIFSKLKMAAAAILEFYVM